MTKEIVFLFYIVVGVVTSMPVGQSNNYLTEREMFEIEILDSENPADRRNAITVAFRKRGTIKMETLEVIAYKLLIDENVDHVAKLKSKQKKGKEMSKEEEDSLVNIYMVDHYLEEIVGKRTEFGRDFVEGVLAQGKFIQYVHGSADNMLFKVRDEVLRHPIAFDEMDFYQDFDL